MTLFAIKNCQFFKSGIIVYCSNKDFFFVQKNTSLEKCIQIGHYLSNFWAGGQKCVQKNQFLKLLFLFILAECLFTGLYKVI